MESTSVKITKQSVIMVVSVKFSLIAHTHTHPHTHFKTGTFYCKRTDGVLDTTIPRDVRAGTASLLIQKETHDKTTIILQGM